MNPDASMRPRRDAAEYLAKVASMPLAESCFNEAAA